jgi:hypothetical protein
VNGVASTRRRRRRRRRRMAARNARTEPRTASDRESVLCRQETRKCGRLCRLLQRQTDSMCDDSQPSGSGPENHQDQLRQNARTGAFQAHGVSDGSRRMQDDRTVTSKARTRSGDAECDAYKVEVACLRGSTAKGTRPVRISWMPASLCQKRG